MKEKITEHLEKALGEFSVGDYYDPLIQAKKMYFSLTGQISEGDDEYEQRMNSFNDWYLFQFAHTNGKTAVELYLDNNEVEKDLTDVFKNFKYSLFEYTGKSLLGGEKLKDLVSGEKVTLIKDMGKLPIVKGELFLGRIITTESGAVLLDGMNLIPVSVKKILQKEIKRLKKIGDDELEYQFLLQIESLKTKWLHYTHIAPEKIFVFDN